MMGGGEEYHFLDNPSLSVVELGGDGVIAVKHC